MIKRFFIGLAAVPAVSALALTACGSADDTNETTTTDSVTVSEATTEADSINESEAANNQLTGGWTLNEDFPTPSIPDEAKEAFDKALDGYTGMVLEPVALIGSQLVSGKNYHFLCKGEAVIANPIPELYFAVVYRDLEGNAEITSVVKLDVADIKTVNTDKSEGVVGGWQVETPPGVEALPKEVGEYFTKAAESYTDIKPVPFALLATQVVAGENYLILCEGTPTDGRAGIYAVTMYKDLEGNAQITEAGLLDMPVYLGQEE